MSQPSPESEQPVQTDSDERNFRCVGLAIVTVNILLLVGRHSFSPTTSSVGYAGRRHHRLGGGSDLGDGDVILATSGASIKGTKERTFQPGRVGLPAAAQEAAVLAAGPGLHIPSRYDGYNCIGTVLGRSCDVPPEVAKVQREYAEQVMKELPWVLVAEATPPTPKNSEGVLHISQWDPADDFMESWAKAAATKALIHWKTYIDPHMVNTFAKRSPRQGCALAIKNMTTGKCFWGKSNQRYIEMMKPVLRDLHSRGINVKDHVLIATNGDDEPMVPMDVNKSSLSIPMAISQQNNGRFYDLVFPTITRRSFMGSDYYTTGLREATVPFGSRGDKLVWRGSPGCSLGCGPNGKFFYPDRNLGEKCRGSKGWVYGDPDATLNCEKRKLESNTTAYEDCADNRVRCEQHPRTKLLAIAATEHKCIDAAYVTGKDKGKHIDFSEYKFVVNVGNNGFADRVKTLLSHGNVIFFHTSGWKEWYYDAMIPWVHYVPVAHDFSDVCAKHDLLVQNPEAAAQISANARKFFLENLRPKDRDVYIGEILLQWGDLWDAHVTQQTSSCSAGSSEQITTPCACTTDTMMGPDCYAGQYCRQEGNGPRTCTTG
jgi:hypothetical protein